MHHDPICWFVAGLRVSYSAGFEKVQHTGWQQQDETLSVKQASAPPLKAMLIIILNNDSNDSARFTRLHLPCYRSVSQLKSILCPATAGGLFEQQQLAMKPALQQTAGHVLKITTEQERKHFRILQR